MMPAKGPRKTVYPLMNDKNPLALESIFQGTNVHGAITTTRICARLRSMYFGHMAVRSFAADRMVAETMVPRVANANVNATKKVAGRLSQRLMSWSGFQSTSPYRTDPADVTMIPMKQTKVKATGIMNN